MLTSFAVGDDSLAEPEMGEAGVAVRRRLSAAAAQRDERLIFVRVEGERLVFRVRESVGG